jgi:Trypsin-like peptidase domain
MFSSLYSITKIYLLLIFAISIFSYIPTSAAIIHPLQSVLKIKTYQKRSDGSYVFMSYGSAVAISSSRILTNAHVVSDADQNPTGYYEVCISTDFHIAPRCISSARLIALDSITDLALLEFDPINILAPVVFAQGYPNIGDTVSTYGYPQIGGDTITRTEWKVAGYDRMMYKIDGGIDHGNSGWGAFDSSGALIGMPTAVASDNSSIGYIIPVDRIQDFIQWHTPGYQILSYNSDPVFVRYLRRNQISQKSPVYILPRLSLKRPQILGLNLKTKIISPDMTMVYLEFRDPYDQAHIEFSCTDDRWVLPTWQIRRDGIEKESATYLDWHITWSDEPDYFIVRQDSGGDKTETLYYKKYPACFTEITLRNTEKSKDSLDRITLFFKYAVSPMLWKQSITETPITSSIFSPDLHTLRSIDSNGEISLVLGVRYSEDVWIHGIFDIQLFADRSWLDASIGTSDVSSWHEYVQKYTRGYDQYTIVDLWGWRKGILSSIYDTDKKSTRIIFHDIYQIEESEYVYRNWTARVPGDIHPNLDRLAQVLSQIENPGRRWIGE